MLSQWNCEVNFRAPVISLMILELDIALALIWNNGRVLVAQRRLDAEHLPGVWEFPGGKCEANETPAQCAVREVREEIGVGVVITRKRATIRHQYSTRIVTLYPFDCRLTAGHPLALQCADWRWSYPQDLRTADFPAANASLIKELAAHSEQEN